MTPDFKHYIQSLVDYFQQRFNLTEYNINLEFAERDPDGATLARVGFNLNYLFMNIEVYPNLYQCYEQKDYREIVTAITHEFCHHFVEPLSNRLLQFTSPSQEKDLEDIVELCTQRITRAIVPTLPDYLYKPPKHARKRS